jgi:hypothetical protein
MSIFALTILRHDKVLQGRNNPLWEHTNCKSLPNNHASRFVVPCVHQYQHLDTLRKNKWRKNITQEHLQAGRNDPSVNKIPKGLNNSKTEGEEEISHGNVILKELNGI